MPVEPPKPKRHLWLDLEDTIITPVTDGWFNVQLINVHKISSFIEEWKPDFVHVFSFAIWDEQQLLRFNMAVRERIERVLGVKISAVPTVDGEIIPTACGVLGISPDLVSFQEASEFWGKQETFRLNMRHLHKANTVPVEVAFMDDAVFNEEFSWPDLKVTGKIINIDKFQVSKLPNSLSAFSLSSSIEVVDGVLFFRHKFSDDMKNFFVVEEELNLLGFAFTNKIIEGQSFSAAIVEL